MNHWTNYWRQTSALNSFAEGDVAQGYHGELLQFWWQIFADIGQGATVIDLGTGNGALALAASQFAKKNNQLWRVIGLDAADIAPQVRFRQQPELASQLAEISFYANTSMEQLPFAAHSAQLIISQFALEYSDMAQSVVEAWRVLQPGGKLVAIMHHIDTPLAQDTAVGLEVMQAFFDHIDLAALAMPLLQRAAQLLKLQTPLKTDPQFNTHNQQLMQAVSTLQQRFTSPPQQDWFNYILHKFLPVVLQLTPENPQHFTKWLGSMRAYQARLNEQQHACITPAKQQQLTVFFEQQHWQYQWQHLVIDKQFFGTALIIHK